MIDIQGWNVKGVPNAVRVAQGSIVIDLDLSGIDVNWSLLAPVLNRSTRKFVHRVLTGIVWSVAWTTKGQVQIEFRAISGWKRSPDPARWVRNQFLQNVMPAIRHVVDHPKFVQRVALVLIEKDRSTWNEKTLDVASIRKRAKTECRKLSETYRLIEP